MFKASGSAAIWICPVGSGTSIKIGSLRYLKFRSDIMHNLEKLMQSGQVLPSLNFDQR